MAGGIYFLALAVLGIPKREVATGAATLCPVCFLIFSLFLYVRCLFSLLLSLRSLLKTNCQVLIIARYNLLSAFSSVSLSHLSLFLVPVLLFQYSSRYSTVVLALIPLFSQPFCTKYLDSLIHCSPSLALSHFSTLCGTSPFTVIQCPSPCISPSS